MRITPDMSLEQLAERMGDTATEQEARAMRDLLCEAGHEDTSDVSEGKWCQYLCHAVEASRAAS